jgi:hypothetical protein
MAAQPRIKLALVATGAELVQAVDAFDRPSTIEIGAVVDAQDRAAGARLAERLRVAPAKSPVDAFKAKPNIVLLVGGDEREYERLLAIKPPGIEVMRAYGARLLLSLLSRPF